MNINLSTPDVGFLVWHGTFFKQVFANSYNNKLLPKPTFTGKLQFICVSVCSTFLVIIAKERFLSTLFCLESLFSKYLFWALWLFNGNNCLAYVKNGFSPKKSSQWRRRWAWPISKVALPSYGFADVFTDSICSRVVVVHTTIVAFVGLKGLL